MHIRENLIKYLCRHAGEYDLQDGGNVARGHGVRSDQHPVNNCLDLILAYARMTNKCIVQLVHIFLRYTLHKKIS